MLGIAVLKVLAFWGCQEILELGMLMIGRHGNPCFTEACWNFIEKHPHTRGCPPSYVCRFINHSKYRYIYHKPSLIGVICTNLAIPNRGTTLYNDMELGKGTKVGKRSHDQQYKVGACGGSGSSSQDMAKTFFKRDGVNVCIT